MNDQLSLWNHAHKNQYLHAHSLKQTQFAEEINAILPPHASILELGCGEGNDSSYFAGQGHTVTATDFSQIAIEQNQKRWSNPNVRFADQDISQPLNYADESFDAVYARLSLHYFTNEVTRKIFTEVARVLKPGGCLAFMCKEVHDPIYGKGMEIEPDMFELDGHVRHFFSKEYATGLLASANLSPESTEVGKEQIYERMSAFIKVVAKRAR